MLSNKKYALALLAGSFCVFGYAPYGIYAIPVLALAVLFALWLRAGSARTAAWMGFAFGLGFFSTGIGWIYVALHDYGDMPMLLAFPATMLFAAFLALFPALVGYAQARFRAPNWSRAIGVMPATWILIEWLRGMIFTGFPWLTLGYAHSDSPLAGYAPVLGVYGVSLAAAVSAGALALLWQSRWSKQGWLALVLLLAIWGLGALLRTVAWTQPYGEPFQRGAGARQHSAKPQIQRRRAGRHAGNLSPSCGAKSGAPHRVAGDRTAAVCAMNVPENYVERLRNHARQNGGDILIGVFERSNGSYYNSVFTLGSS